MSELKKSVNFKPKKSIHLNCLCGSKEATLYFDPYKETGFFNNYKLIICNKCKLVRTDPSPLSDDGDAIDLYSDPNYYKESVTETNFWLEHAKKTLEVIKDLKKGKLLDIGCGVGYMVEAANSLGFDASGIDLNPYAVEAGKKIFGSNLKHTTIDKVDEKYDIIISNHVIEHLLSPKDFLDSISTKLNNGGYLLLGVPNIEGGIPKTLRMLNKIPNIPGSNWLWVGYQPKEHLWHFTPKSMESFLKREGWEKLVLRVNRNNSYAYAKVNKARQKFIQKVWKLFERINMADEFTILCQKKN